MANQSNPVHAAKNLGVHSDEPGNFNLKAAPSLPEIVKRALVETIVNIGQLTAPEHCQLDRAVKRGYLSKGKGGPFPALKTMYARPGFNFIEDRNHEVEYAMILCDLDDKMREQCKREGSPV